MIPHKNSRSPKSVCKFPRKLMFVNSMCHTVLLAFTKQLSRERHSGWIRPTGVETCLPNWNILQHGMNETSPTVSVSIRLHFSISYPLILQEWSKNAGFPTQLLDRWHLDGMGTTVTVALGLSSPLVPYFDPRKDLSGLVFSKHTMPMHHLISPTNHTICYHCYLVSTC